jgi:sugar transferase EpsL
MSPGIYRKFGKRLFDLGLVIPALIVFSPLIFILALLVRWKLGSPILFRQQRPGLNGRPFTLLKFRTMLPERDAYGKLLSEAGRLTPFGRFLRSASLDEWPELINVLKGEMSLIGPRPLLMRYLNRYTPRQRRRHEVKPGLSGWAQVNGRNAISWEQKFGLDVWYVDHCSFGLDLKILTKTLWTILKREGITHEAHPSMPEFLGMQESIKEY